MQDIIKMSDANMYRLDQAYLGILAPDHCVEACRSRHAFAHQIHHRSSIPRLLRSANATLSFLQFTCSSLSDPPYKCHDVMQIA